MGLKDYTDKQFVYALTIGFSILFIYLTSGAVVGKYRQLSGSVDRVKDDRPDYSMEIDDEDDDEEDSYEMETDEKDSKTPKSSPKDIPGKKFPSGKEIGEGDSEWTRTPPLELPVEKASIETDWVEGSSKASNPPSLNVPGTNASREMETGKGAKPPPPNVRRGVLLLDRYYQCASTVESRNTSDPPLLPTKKQLIRFAKARRVYYSMVIKTGSGTTIDIAKQLSRVNHFRAEGGVGPAFLKLGVYFIIKTKQQMDRAIPFLLGIQEPVLYMSHTPYINFTGRLSKSGKPVDVVYMNIIREPFERLVSFYYASRTLAGHRNHGMDNQRINMSYDDCVKRNHNDCMSDGLYSQMTTYFCGHGVVCRSPSKEAFELAKKHIHEDFAVVGMLEDYESFVAALEDVIPQYFKGAVSVRRRLKAKPSAPVHSNPHPKPSAWARKVITEKLHYEYELYAFIRKRFAALMKLLKCMKSEA